MNLPNGSAASGRAALDRLADTVLNDIESAGTLRTDEEVQTFADAVADTLAEL